jgi:hypothetical protein
MLKRTAYVITREDLGIYLDSTFGEHFWTRGNTGDQEAVRTFISAAEARKFVAENFENANDPGAYRYVPVTPSWGSCASFADLTRAGLGKLLPPPNPPPRPTEFGRQSSLRPPRTAKMTFDPNRHGWLAFKSAGELCLLRVLESRAGFYIGTLTPGGDPNTRESADYYSDRKTAEQHLTSHSFNQKLAL